MIREILQYPDPVLRLLCSPLIEVSEDTKSIIGDMFETMYSANGRGLAGPQIGFFYRIFVMDTAWRDGAPKPLAMINPEILDKSEETQFNKERCLSIAGEPIGVTRVKNIQVMWMDQNGEQFRRGFNDFAAACICHEIDHLDGKLILDFK